MVIIPAIDLKEGACVRLRQGRMDDATMFSDDPVAVAIRWRKAGARRLHIVDLDGAISGKPRHATQIKEIIEACPDMDVQVGGGIRDEHAVTTYLDSGAHWVILGTVAVKDPDFAADMCRSYRGKVIIGIDARDGCVSTQGWLEQSDISALSMAKRFSSLGAAAIIYTDISRDGMMSGINIRSTMELANSVTIPVIASGGAHNMQEIETLVASKSYGVIVGRALYEGDIDLAEAVQAVEAL
jgi:phosphoribosylformimino-5-aminoimidazole carboxamide ribotide isomerase